ncbi:mannosyl-oligosaccharide glucosidase [Rhizoctonia solani AG-3 Rhs1AP]|uniref:Mannosyl-oligosaccharide glucosidase n=2 Tax=Rhizoctonia solani AG-3 TaxID=1086053 RepID=A0A074SEN8_9AGAM|nr:mannosyl-oligosaccharide glucosidase [Rhizoctonia solani AG-3 Rhs1AP]KEP55253.1 mannosyl-oligosaccharide glucosidase [Rhizoctonia solani 123E]
METRALVLSAATTMRRATLYVALLGSLSRALAQEATNGTYDDSLFWGTYRPNLYFGLRPRLPQSLMAGLMWFGTQHYQSLTKTRHSCEQGDELSGYTWTEHDMREGGVQVLKDPYNNLELTTEWLKVPGGSHGGSWAARIKGKPLDPTKISRNSLIFYVGLEGLGGLDLETEEQEDGYEGSIGLVGITPDLGDFSIKIVDGPDNAYIREGAHAEAFARTAGKTHVVGAVAQPGQVWQAKDILLKNIIDHATTVIKPFNEDKQNPPDPAFVLEFEDEVRSGSNLYAVQKTFDGPFSFDVYYQSGSAGTKLDEATITAGIDAFKAKFTERFDLTIPVPEKYKAFAKDITSNLMGGIGYFYGTSIVDRSGSLDDDDEDETFMSEAERKERGRPELAPPTQLLTATPSRSFFPRGFYWDEGFHLQHIGTWDNDLSLEILKSWVELIDEDGWVGREQILGEEARSKVPAEFQTQYPNYANPPTLTMALSAFISRLEENAEPSLADLGMDQLPIDTTSTAPGQSSKLLSPPAARAYLNEIYPALRRHYHWFRRTQRGQIRQWGRKATARGEAYRWRGRSAEHVLTSGLDDYPRPVPPHVGELHVDLMSWMGYFSNMMRRIADFIGESEDAAEYETIEKGIKANLDDLHWSKEKKMYCDVTVNDEDDSEHVCHAGYVSLFPLLLGLLEPSSPHLGPILDLIHDPERLWSPYGIRSLAADHPLFGQGENYWRGPVWIQMNYLALSALHQKYAKEPGPHQAKAKLIYDELRENVVSNVFKEYERTGYVWEQYDPLSGEGKRSHPFTGWTSLVALILAEKY